VEVLSSAPEDLIFPPDIMRKVKKSQVQALYDLEPGAPGIVWFCATAVTKKVTKNNKQFYVFDTVDDQSRTIRLRVWGQFKSEPEPYTIWMAEAERDPNWGPSTMASKLRRVETK
jgi:hypothetical protein